LVTLVAWAGEFSSFIRDPIAIAAIITSLLLSLSQSRYIYAVFGICIAYGSYLRVTREVRWHELGWSEAFMNAFAVSTALRMCAGVCFMAAVFHLVRVSHRSSASSEPRKVVIGDRPEPPAGVAGSGG
jgi:hypothetical protein